MDRQLLVNNIVGTTKAARLYKMPIILSTVNVKTGLNKETIPQLRKELVGLPSYDRRSINAWEDKEFLEAVSHRKKKIDNDRIMDGSMPFIPFLRRSL